MGILLRLIGVSIPVLASLVLILPLIIDGLTQLFELRESNNIFRLLTGALFGIGCICVQPIS